MREEPSITEALVVEAGRTDLHRTRTTSPEPHELQPDEVRYRVERFALTANNVTYWKTGTALGYWSVFPTDEVASWGRVPAWGHLRAVESRHAGVVEGSRLFGLVPMGTHVVLRPGRILANGLIDASASRLPLPPAYNLYLDPAHDRLHVEGTEDAQCVLRPLFITSWVLDRLHREAWPQAVAVLSSASSKTAVGLAHLLSRRGVPTIGLTSGPNRPFVAGLGCYDQVLTYDEVDRIPARSAAYLDFAGSAAVRGAVHERLGDLLVHTAVIGYLHDTSDRADGADRTDLPGPVPVRFSGPDEIRRQVRALGADAFDQQLATAWHDFRAWSASWLVIDPVHTAAQVEATLARLVVGAVAPDRAAIGDL